MKIRKMVAFLSNPLKAGENLIKKSVFVRDRIDFASIINTKSQSKGLLVSKDKTFRFWLHKFTKNISIMSEVFHLASGLFNLFTVGYQILKSRLVDHGS